MKFFCMFIILMSFVQMQMAGPAYPPSPPYNSGGYLQGQAYSSNPDSHSYNTGQSAGGQAYYANNAGAPYNAGQAYSAGAAAYNAGQYLGDQAYSSGGAGSSYNSGQSSNYAGASSNAGQSLNGQVLDIMLPQGLLEDFEYMPTDEGYRFSYKLTDGTMHEEMGIIPNADGDNPGKAVMGAMMQTDPNDRNSSTITMITDADRNGSRPRGMLKSRKLSPKSLQSLAG